MPARAVGLVCLTGTAASQIALLVGRDRLPMDMRFALTSIAAAVFGGLFIRHVRRATLTAVRIASVTVVLLIIAVVAQPVSHDIWSYAMYGRMVSAHHESPYTHIPADFPHDPVFRVVGWRKTPSVYGPLFVAVAALGTSVTGPSLLWNRVFFQGLEALAVSAAMVIIWRRTRDPAALAFVGLNPMLIAVVADGHNDLLVGLAVLAGVILLMDGRPVGAGMTVAGGALVKVVAVLPLAGLMVWSWLHRGRASAVRMGAAAGACIAGAYALAGGFDALRPVLHAAGARTSRASIWGLTGLGTATIATVGIASTAVLVFVVLVLGVVRASAPWTAGALLLCFVLSGQYVLPWYVAWALPILGLMWWTPLSGLAALNGALLHLAYVDPHRARPWFQVFYGAIVPIISVGEIIVLVALAGWTRRSAGLEPSWDEDRAGLVGEVAAGS